MKRIALLIDNLYSSTYQQEVVNGFIQAVRDRELKLFIFIGGLLGKVPGDPYAVHRTRVYELIGKEQFDGVIMTTSICGLISREETVQFLSRYSGIPIVFYGPGPEQYSQVLVDNKKGMEKIVRHFIEEHHYKKIAFVTGLAGHRDFEERFDAYREQLAVHDLSFSPELVANGSYPLEYGRHAVMELLDQNQVRFEALVAATDVIAISAQAELDSRGYKIPGDVAVAGFDDVLEASGVLPGLTTVRQPYAAMAARALDFLDDFIQNGGEKKLEYIVPDLVIRQSCGCLSHPKNDDWLHSRPDCDADGDFSYQERRPDFIRKMTALLAPAGIKVPENDLVLFLDAVCAEITGERKGFALIALEELLIRCVDKKTDLEVWQETLTLLRYFFSPRARVGGVMANAEDFYHQARLLIGHFQMNKENQEIASNLKQTDQIARVCETLIHAVETKELREAINVSFPLLSIGNFLFAEFIGAAGNMETSRLIALIRDGQPHPLTEDVIYPSRKLFPSAAPAFDSRVCFVLPVTNFDHDFGYVVFEYVPGLSSLYATLTRELGKNYYLSRLIQIRKDAEESLKQLATDLAFRNRELEDFAHIASHDLKEPLWKITFFGERIKAAAAAKLSEAEADYLARMLHAVSRMDDLIEGLLAYSRVTTKQQPFTPVDLKTIVGEVIQDLEVRISETKGRVEVGELPPLRADPTQIRQLFQNLIGNALKYHSPDVGPVVTVNSSLNDKHYEISVADNGIGFDQKESERMFGIFQRLVGKNEYKGAGVGLAICKKIVERHGGSISAHGEKGKGAKFIIRLPRIG